MAIAIRVMRPDEVRTAASIASAAYGRTISAAEIELRQRIQPGGFLMAAVDGVPAGIGGIVNYETYAVIGLMGTTPRFQGRGVGRAVLGVLLELAEGWGSPMIGLDATEAGAPMYRRVGFHEVDRTSAWRRRHAISHLEDGKPADAIQALAAGDLEAVATLDREVFGAPRGRALSALLDTNPGRALISRGAGRLTGYLILQENRIGPGVAVTGSAMSSLFRQALTMSFRGEPDILLPDSNIAAVQLLTSAGFAVERSLRYMVRGADAPPADRSRLLGLANFGLG